MRHAGLFLTFEGIDGSGKSTQLQLLTAYLRRRGIEVVATREPGGTPAGERIRRLLLTTAPGVLSPWAELMLMYAARAQHLEEVIRPALAQGKIVVSDRFSDASLAYQGYGRTLGFQTVRALDRLVCGATKPALTFLLDLPAPTARKRGRRRGQSRDRRFEPEGLRFQERVRQGYLALARREPARIKVIAAGQSVTEVQRKICVLAEKLLRQKFTHGL